MTEEQDQEPKEPTLEDVQNELKENGVDGTANSIKYGGPSTPRVEPTPTQNPFNIRAKDPTSSALEAEAMLLWDQLVSDGGGLFRVISTVFILLNESYTDHLPPSEIQHLNVIKKILKVIVPYLHRRYKVLWKAFPEFYKNFTSDNLFQGVDPTTASDLYIWFSRAETLIKLEGLEDLSNKLETARKAREETAIREDIMTTIHDLNTRVRERGARALKVEYRLPLKGVAILGFD